MPHKDPIKRKAWRTAYNLANAEKIHARKAAHYAANRESILATNAAWRAKNTDKMRSAHAVYYLANREKAKTYDAARRSANPARKKASDAAYYAANTDKVRANVAAWKRENPEVVRAINARHRARNAHAPVIDFTEAQWKAMQVAYHHRCVYCGKRAKGKLTKDHITPYVKGGSHTLSNIVPACKSCNSRKNAGEVLIPVQPLLLLEEEC